MDIVKALYIDPGTGGMLFSVLFGLFSVVVFAFRTLFMRMKFHSGSDKNSKINSEKIPLAVFSDHKRYWTTFEPLMEEFEKRQKKVIYYTLSEDDPVFAKKYKYIKGEYLGEGYKAFSKLNMLNASLVLSTTPSLDVFQWKRSKNVDCYIHIPHAPNDITLYHMFGTDHFDAIILSGAYQEKQIRQLEEKRGIKPREIALCGIPYMDAMKKKLEASGEVPSHDRTVLLAPSWGESGILSRFGDKLIDALIDTGYKIIIRPHPQSFTSEKELIGRLMSKYDDESKVQWNRDNDNFEVLRQSDILISDFSGVTFDFSLVFNKPIIYTNTSSFDTGIFDAYWIDEPLWTHKILPELGIELNEDNMSHVKDLIDKCIEDPSFAKGRDKARSETWVHMGEGTKRSVDFILRKYDETVAKKNKEKREAEKAAKTDKKNSRKKLSLAKGRG